MLDIKQNWPDWAVSNVWKLVKHNQKIREYLPAEDMDKGTYPDREFFWGVAFTVLPFWASGYHGLVIEKKRKEIKENPSNKNVLIISDEWRKRLGQFAYKPKSKYQSNFCNDSVCRQEWTYHSVV